LYGIELIGSRETVGFASDIHVEIFGFIITADFDLKKKQCGNLLAC